MSFPNLGYSRINACLRLPETFRSLTTSFVGSWCQGIHTCTLCSLTGFSLENPRRSFSHFFTPTLSKSLCRSSRLGYFLPLPARATTHSGLLLTPDTLTHLVETTGFEPATPWLQTMCSTN